MSSQTKDSSQSAAMTGSALVRAAKKARRMAQAANDADREFTRLIEVRYGFAAHSELTDELVEVIRYGNGSQKITLDWLDSVMLQGHGCFPQNADVQPPAPAPHDHE